MVLLLSLLGFLPVLLVAVGCCQRARGELRVYTLKMEGRREGRERGREREGGKVNKEGARDEEGCTQELICVIMPVKQVLSHQLHFRGRLLLKELLEHTPAVSKTEIGEF